MVLLPKKYERRFAVNQGQTIFSQVIDFLPMKKFRQCVNRYDGMQNKVPDPASFHKNVL